MHPTITGLLITFSLLCVMVNGKAYFVPYQGNTCCSYLLCIASIYLHKINSHSVLNVKNSVIKLEPILKIRDNC